jgi:arsenate reductase-like glutaredoxin family protein
MPKTTLAVKVDYKTANKVKKFCRERGIKYGFFVEKALEERLEREELKEDLLDLKTLRSLEKEAVSIEDYLKKRRV